MKVALLCDTHLGCRSDSKVFLEHQKRFFTDQFFPYIKQHNIDTILHLGDIFDRRKYINFNTLKESRQFFFEALIQSGATMHAIIGNHDTFLTNTNKINASDLLLGEYLSQIHIYTNLPVSLEFGSTKVIMCPWLVKDNTQEALDIIKKSDAHILMGHFDLKGFEMMKGVVSTHGLDHRLFKQFESVYSGHYHHGSQYGNVRYLGTQYEMNWSDFDSRKGFYILDTETRDLEYIENKTRIFYKLEYDDVDLTIEELNELDFSGLDNCYVKVIVKNRTNSYLYELFLDKLNESGAADVKTMEIASQLSSDIENGVEDVKDTRDILHTYIDNLETNLDRAKIKSFMDKLYSDANEI